MWTSVPQIEEIFTRISTSSAVGSGTGTSVTFVLFGAGFSLTAAFILAGMVNPPKPGRRGADAAEGFQPSVGSMSTRTVPRLAPTSRTWVAGSLFESFRGGASSADRVELARSVPDDDEEVLLPREFLVQLRLPRVHSEDGSGVELRGARHHDQVRY